MATSQWARRHQLLYGGGVLLFFLVLLLPIIFYITYTPASCFDGKLNQSETDVDKGGTCVLLDERYVQPHAVLWSRTFAVRDGFYNAVAYIENPNQNAGVLDAVYQFKFYDEKNILIAERFGRTSIIPEKVFPIFEGRIDTGNRIPARTTFGFVNDFKWERMKDTTVGLTVINEKVSDIGTTPRVDAELYNTTVEPFTDISLVATLFDASGNAFASSRTLVQNVEPGEKKSITFTWPEPFADEIARIDIIPLAPPAIAQ